jgi:uncharacterized membrane protein
MMLACTVLGAAGQILIKLGAGTLATSSPFAVLLAMLTNPALFAGYVLYGLMTVLFILVLRNEELSIVYPIISLTYVWVTALSAIVFREAVSLPRVLGVAIIVAGVGVLGMDGKK